jgi:hypothetical protein
MSEPKDETYARWLSGLKPLSVQANGLPHNRCKIGYTGGFLPD